MSLQGNLTDIPLSDLLQVFVLQNRTGTLYIWQKTCWSEICFNKAVLYSARMWARSEELDVQKVSCQGEEAIYALLDWNEGEFSFELTTASFPPAQNVFSKVPYLILEHERQRDEQKNGQAHARLASRKPHLVAHPPAQAQISLDLEQWQLLLQINGDLTLEEISYRIRRPLAELTVLVLDLEKKKLIEWEASTPATPKEPAFATTTRHNNLPGSSPAKYNAAYNPNGSWAATPARQPVLVGAGPILSPAKPAPPKVQRNLLSGVIARIRGI